MNAQGVPPSWLPDPLRRFELRYWDGWHWTHHVATHGQASVDPLVVGPFGPPVGVQMAGPVLTPNYVPPTVPKGRAHRTVQRQIDRTGAVLPGQTGGGTLFTEQIMVVNQKPKIIEVNAEYAVYSQSGHKVGAVREVGQSLLRNAISSRSSASRVKRFQILDHHGTVILTLLRPAKIARSTLIVRYPDGTEAGRLVQKTLGLLGKVKFDLVSDGRSLGSIRADSWGVWDFSIQDIAGEEVGRITKGSALGGGQTSTKRDKYVVEIAIETEGPLRMLAVVSAIAIDTALRQHQ